LRLATTLTEAIVLDLGLDGVVTSEVFAIKHLLRLKERFSLGDSKRGGIRVEALVIFFTQCVFVSIFFIFGSMILRILDHKTSCIVGGVLIGGF
jgi:hypothetical protein